MDQPLSLPNRKAVAPRRRCWRLALILTLFAVPWCGFGQERIGKLTKTEKRQILKTLLGPYPIRPGFFPGREDGIHVLLEELPKDFVALFPRKLNGQRVILLNREETRQLGGEGWRYLAYGWLKHRNNRLYLTVESSEYCARSVETIEFRRKRGKLRHRRLGATVGECLRRPEAERSDERDEDIPVVKKKPNE